MIAPDLTVADSPGRRSWLAPIALGVIALLIYAWRLDASPIYLHYDEVFFGLQGHAIQSTWRDLNGRLLPLYFQLETSMNWYQPAAIYWTALVLSIVPLSDAAIRLPTVLIGVITIVLMFVVARRVFRSTGWAVLAAVLLMLTPAHFIHSRLAMDYVYPLPCILGWMLCLFTYFERPSNRLLFLATSCLGLGFFTYIAAVALMPMYLAITLGVLWFDDKFRTRAGIAIGGFAWPLLGLGVFLLVHPEVVFDLMRKYGLAGGAATGAGLDPLQQLRESINTRTVSDTLNMFHRFFSPGYLFVTGGSNITNSTREAGVFLVSMVVFLAAGIRHVLVTATRSGVILLFGFITSPIPALIMDDDYAIDRVLAILPFATLLAAIGVQQLWAARLHARARPIAVSVSAALALVGVGYGAIALVGRGHLSGSAVLLIVAAAAIWATGAAMDRERSWRPVAILLLALMALQFAQFQRDYFGGYRARSAGWFGGNNRSAVEELMRLGDGGGAPELHLSTDIPYIRSFWRFYLSVHGREALAERTRVFDGTTIDLDRIPPNSLLLAASNDPIVNALAEQGAIRKVGVAVDPAESGPPVERFVIYRR